jgi:hypothetical protein
VTGRYAEPPQPGRHHACGGDLALLAGDRGAMIEVRSSCWLMRRLSKHPILPVDVSARLEELIEAITEQAEGPD